VVAWKFIASQPYLGREIAGTDLSSLPNFLYLSELPRSVGLLGPNRPNQFRKAQRGPKRKTSTCKLDASCVSTCVTSAPHVLISSYGL
jgi:hypothetical protein